MALPFRTTGSLRPAFAPARVVTLAVKHAYAYAQTWRFPTAISVPSCSSVTLWEETAPVKLPTTHCPQSRLGTGVRTPTSPGWYFKVDSTPSGEGVSQSPSYPTQVISKSNVKL